MQERRPRKRNPDWVEEELVLALDLYRRSGKLDDTDPAVDELSSVLRALGIHTEGPDWDQHIEHFQFSVTDKVVEATRGEQSLVLAFLRCTGR